MDKNASVAVVGLGASGLAMARWFFKHRITFSLHDNRVESTLHQAFQSFLPATPLYLGEFKEANFAGCTHVFLSPGVSPHLPIFQKLKAEGIHLKNDISLFGEVVEQPVIGITGSNGKSTVTTLVALMLQAAHYEVGFGGNLGTPALDLLAPQKTVYVLELSSFQLELANEVPFHAAALLNLTPDHLDRHANIAAYLAAKQNIFSKAKIAVMNRQDPQTYPPAGFQCLSFGSDEPQASHEFGIRVVNGEEWLAQGQTNIMPVSALKIYGQHNLLNALAAMALSSTLAVSHDVMRSVLAEFSGLPHRAQLILNKEGITWFNDSKGTNTGATIATFMGLSTRCQGKIILILGGSGKGEDYRVLKNIAAQSRAVLLLGAESFAIQKAIEDCGIPILPCQTIDEVVLCAKAQAAPGDFVLFSPACASFDMFENYKVRGEKFTECVKNYA